jgi:uncharacterized protein
MDKDPPSPCTGVCRLSPDQVCLGCGRSLAEIAAWPTLAPAGKRAVLARLAGRGRGL